MLPSSDPSSKPISAAEEEEEDTLSGRASTANGCSVAHMANDSMHYNKPLLLSATEYEYVPFFLVIIPILQGQTDGYTRTRGGTRRATEVQSSTLCWIYPDRFLLVGVSCTCTPSLESFSLNEARPQMRDEAANYTRRTVSIERGEH